MEGKKSLENKEFREPPDLAQDSEQGPPELPRLDAYAHLVRFADASPGNQPRTLNAVFGASKSATARNRFKELAAYHGTILESRGKQIGFVLTPDGQTIAALARSIVATARELEKWRTGQLRPVRIGGFAATFQTIVPALLRTMTPDFAVELIEPKSRDELVAMTRARLVDVAFDSDSHATRHDALDDSGEFGSCVIQQSQQLVPILNLDQHGDVVKKKFGNVAAALAEAPRVAITRWDYNAVRHHLPADKPVIVCSSLAAVVAQVRAGVAGGLVWKIPNLTDVGVVVCEVAQGIGVTQKFFAFWLKAVAEERAKIKKDPVWRFIEVVRGEHPE